jgi:hypothetical protein
MPSIGYKTSSRGEVPVATKVGKHLIARSLTRYRTPMRPLAVSLVMVLLLSSLVPLLGGQVRDVQGTSLPSWTKVFHLHDGPDYLPGNYYDWMNCTGPRNPADTNYDSQTPPIDGISIRKNPSPNHKHFWVMFPGLGSDVTIIGDLTAHLWARSRGNQSGTLIMATFSDMAPGESGNPAAWTDLGQDTVALNGPTYSDFDSYDLTITGLSYTLASGHSLVLTLQRGDSFNDQLIIMFDTTAKDSFVILTATSSVSVNAAWTEDASHTPASVFSDQENILVGANVSDPYGAYDILGANASVTYSSNGTTYPSPTIMSANRTDPAQPPYWIRFELSLSSLPPGVFTINVTATDYQGSPTWLTCSITVVRVDHFGVSVPARAVAGSSFNLTLTALDSANATITNWIGTVQLDTFHLDGTTNSSGNLSIPALVFTLGDSGQVTNSSVNYSSGDETILIRASSGLRYGWSSPMHVSSGPVVSIQMNVLSNWTVGAGTLPNLVATGYDRLGNVNTTWMPIWNVTGGIGFISGSGTSVTFEPRAIGVGEIDCLNDYNGIRSVINVTVVVGSLARIEINASFDPQRIPEGESRILVATGYDAVNNSLTLDNVTWDTDTAGSIHPIGWGPSANFTAGYLPESGLIHARKGSIVGTVGVTIIDSPDGPSFSEIPPQYANENSETWNLGLSGYWHDRYGTGNLVWWADNVNTSLFFVSHDQTSNSVIVFHTQQNQYGDSTFDLWAVDQNGYRAHTVVTVHIVHVNQPPAFVNNPPTTLYVKFDVPYVFDFSYYVSDIDNAKSDLILRSSSSNVVFDGLNATLMFPRKNGDESYFEFVTLNLSDGQATADLRIVVWATTDTPPSLIKNLPDITIDEGAVNFPAFDLDDYYTDVDNQTLYYSYGFHNVQVYINPQSHEVLLSAPGEWSGTEEGVFTATDPIGALKSDTIHVTVRPVNDPPEVLRDIGMVFVKYNQAYYLYLGPFIFDPDNSLGSLSFNIDNANITEGTSISGAPRLKMLFPPNLDPKSMLYTGPYTVKVNMTISDPLKMSVTCQFEVRVTGNGPPQVIAPNPDQLYYSFPENSYLNGSLRLYDLFSDPDDSTLTFQITGQNNVMVKLFANGNVNLSSVVNWSGTESLTVKAFDSHFGWSLIKLYVVVTPVNQAPVIYPIPNFINKGASYRNAHYPIFQFIYDSDNPYSSLTITATPAGNAFVVGGDLYVSVPEGVKTITVTLQASDGKLSSNVMSFKVGVATTMAEKIGWPYSFPLVLLGVGVAAFFIAGRIPRPYELENLFLIHNDGRLVSNVTREQNSTLDKDVVSAMFTAVQEFVRDSFQKGEVGLKKLEIGDKNVVIEKGHSAYLALVYSGWPTKDTFDMLPMLLSDIEERYKERLEKWNGTAKTVKGVDRMLQDYMSDKFQPGMWHDEEEMAEQEWVDILDKEA